MLVGERPGLGQSESMSCYGVYRPTAATLESDRSVISNIHREGTPPVEAAAVIVDLVRQMMQHNSAEQGAQSRFFRLTTCRKSAGERRKQPFFRRF